MEEKIRTLICGVFGFPSFSEFEWNMIIDENKIIKNLNEVDIYMFDDNEIREQIKDFQRELNNDATVVDDAVEKIENFPYP